MLQPLSSLLEILPDGVPSFLEENFRLEQGYPFAAMFETMLNETDAAQIGGGLLGDLFATSVNLPVRLCFRKANDRCMFVLLIIELN
jgi:hypothetical protein